VFERKSAPLEEPDLSRALPVAGGRLREAAAPHGIDVGGAIFARGAVKAALWARAQKPGLYAMTDVLGLNQ